jgi:hypothetical protein
LQAPRGMAFGLNGDLFVADDQAARIWRKPAGGVLSSFMTFAKPYLLARDGFGDLLVTTAGDTIYRVSPYGQRSVFAVAVASEVTGITIGPDGDVWAGARTEIIRFSPLGARTASLALPAGCSGVPSLAFSPLGVLHFVGGGCPGVYGVVNGVPQLVIPERRGLTSLAFDTHGWLWVTDATQRAVLLYDAGYQLREDPFATAINAPTTLAFVRTGTGMTRRLLASHLSGSSAGERTIGEMNPNGMGASGWSIGIDLRVDGATRGATRGSAYRDTVRVLNASTPVTFTVYSGSLPPGIGLRSNGELTGTATASGTYAFSVIAQSGDRLGFGRVSLVVNEPGSPPADQPSTITVIRALLGVGSALAPDVVQFLDQQGNTNGVLDIGDLRAYLRAQGQLP